MTESFGPYCGARLDLDLPPSKHGSCGRPFAGVEVRIVDPETGSGASRRATRARSSCAGRTSCAASAAARATSSSTPTASTRPATSGSLDADGYLWFAGRLDDMFKVKGATVYPAEVEAALRAIAGVAQAFVTDVAADGGAPEVAALVVSAADHEIVAGAARARLSSFKVPTLWLVVPDPGDVPMTATGKVDKAALQALLRARGVRP